MLALAACAAVPVHKEAIAVHGIAIETLQSAVNISFISPAGQMSGNGVLIYRRPDSFRLTILAPFGQSIVDIVVNGEDVLCLMESRKQVWQGKMQELPDWLGIKVWTLLQWAVEPPHPAGPALIRSFTRTDGTVEKVSYDAAGFVVRKVSAAGDEVTYSDYLTTERVAVPGRIEIRTADGSTLKLVLDDPEVNRPLEGALLHPRFEHYEILPLAEFKGF